MIKITSLKTFLTSLSAKQKIYILLFVIGLLLAVCLGTTVITLFVQLINPQVDLKYAAFIVGALLAGLGSIGCFAIYFKK